MAIVLFIGLVFGLAIPAVEVYSAKEYHIHTYVETKGRPCLASWRRPAPFWPRYGRRLIGLPWRTQPVCGTLADSLEVYCEFSHPEMRVEVEGRVAYTFSSEQEDRLEALEEQRAKP